MSLLRGSNTELEDESVWLCLEGARSIITCTAVQSLLHEMVFAGPLVRGLQTCADLTEGFSGGVYRALATGIILDLERERDLYIKFVP